MNEKTETSIALADPSSEATKIEQTRAIAEVQGALTVAQQRPRDVLKAHKSILESCKMKMLAEKAFFSYSRGGSTVTGPSIHLARELARCWGNIDYGIKELSRNDDDGFSEMLAFSWDLETNTRAETTFIVPHRRGTRRGIVNLTDVRDVYENNANMGARRVREMILGNLPPWLVEDAKQKCFQTLEDGGGEPIERRRSVCVQWFESIGISREILEDKVGKSMDLTTPVELANLNVMLNSLRTGELQKKEFLEDTGAAELTKELADASKESPPPPTGETEPSPDAAPSLPEDGQQNSPGDGSTPAEDAPGEPLGESGPDTPENQVIRSLGPQAVALMGEIAKAKTEDELETATARFDGLGDDDLATVRAAAQRRMSEIAAELLAAG